MDPPAIRATLSNHLYLGSIYTQRNANLDLKVSDILSGSEWF